MALLADCLPCTDRRLSMDSTMGFGKRAAKQDSGLCLVCGRRATGRCSKCAIATFCGPQCQETAHRCHSGACEAAQAVLTRRITQRWLPREELSLLQHMIVLAGQNCNPVSSAKDRGLQGCSKVLAHVARNPQLMQRDVADFLFIGIQSLMKHKICCNPHIYTFCILDSCLKKGSAEAFAESLGQSIGAKQSSQDVSEKSKRYMDWQKTVLMPVQEMFGQIGIGRYWESEPAPIDAGMTSGHSSPTPQGRSVGGSPDIASRHSTQSRNCKTSTDSWVNRHSRGSQLSMERTHSMHSILAPH